MAENEDWPNSIRIKITGHAGATVADKYCIGME